VKSFAARILYREPTYEGSAGKSKRTPYSFGFEMKAVDAVDALQLALWESDSTQRLSCVGWVREVVHIEINVLEPR
jgi:hypothetical protein